MSQKKFYKREDLVGKMIVNQEGKKVGTVKDTAYDQDGKLALIVSKEGGGSDDYLSINDIKSIGDIVLLKDVTGQPEVRAAPIPQLAPVVAAPPQRAICPKCGYSNAPAAKFCVKCGNRMG